ncbi:4-(cytidine 5'-diphospho)-2-C-methyl-D-erythritol kinase [Candidatus Marinamargulisbacteria bacterium SCGC AAA071-K20]|nr:4-(cytidine 5'-diphospho)-2-C-methyl-D-erythritol kinase [Candidatus Marinamargulisbacteria bacterium SCGC AAA071-K20]
MTPHLVRTFAKVNLSLLVYPPNDQGMHPIYSIFQNISLFDELEITESNTFQITCSNPNVPTNNLNLLSKIYSHFKNILSTGFKIHLKKNIPMGGGLGGGSSNAAGFLQYLNKSQNWNFSTNKLITISKLFGSDIAFFLVGGTAIVTGTGNIVTSVPQKLLKPLLLLMPNIHCNTKDIYDSFDKQLKPKLPNKESIETINRNHIGTNSLKKAVFGKHKLFHHLEQTCTSFNKALHLSGSGACCFIKCDSESESHTIQNILKDTYPSLKTEIYLPINTGITIEM